MMNETLLGIVLCLCFSIPSIFEICKRWYRKKKKEELLASIVGGLCLHCGMIEPDKVLVCDRTMEHSCSKCGKTTTVLLRRENR